MKSFALCLAFIMRHTATWKSPTSVREVLSLSHKQFSAKQYTAVSRKVVWLKSKKRTRQYRKAWWVVVVHCCIGKFTSFQRDGRRCYEYLFACVKRNKMDSELLTCLLKFIEYFPDHLSALSHTLLRFFWTTFVETAVCVTLLIY